MPLTDADIGLVPSGAAAMSRQKLSDADIGLVSELDQTSSGDKLSLFEKVLNTPYLQHVIPEFADPKNLVQNTVNDVMGRKVLPLFQGTHMTERAMKGGEVNVNPFNVGVKPGAPLPPVNPNTVSGALQLIVPRLIDAVTANPEMLAVGGEGQVAKLGQALLTSGMAAQGVQEASAPGVSAGERTTGVVNTLLGLLGAGAAGKVASAGEVKPSGLAASDVTPRPVYVQGNKGQDQRGVMQDTGRLLPEQSVGEFARSADEKQRIAQRVQNPANQLPEKAQGPLEVAKAEAQQKLQSAQELQPTAQQGFVAGGRGVADAGNAAQMHDLMRPKALLTDSDIGLVEHPEVGNRPPMIAGVTDAQGNQGVLPVTREQTDLGQMHSGVAPDNEMTKKLRPALLVNNEAYHGKETDKTHADILTSAIEKAKRENNPDFLRAAADAFSNDEQHIFTDPQGNKLNRLQAGAAVGKPGQSLRSEDLMDMNSGVPVKWDDVKKTLGLKGDFTQQGVKIAMFDHGFKNEKQEVDAGQLKNRVMNKLGLDSGEAQMWKGLGIDEKFKAGEKTSPEAMAKWMTENGPKVEVRKFGEGGQTPEVRELNQLTHWFETKYSSKGMELYNDGTLRVRVEPTMENNYTQSDHVKPQDTSKLVHYLGSMDEVNKLRRLTKLSTDQKVLTSGKDAHWSSVAPKSEKDMPGYVEIAVVKNQTEPNPDMPKTGSQAIKFPSSHNFPPNTLGFVRGYMENGANLKKYNPGKYQDVADNEKVFFTIEAQYDQKPVQDDRTKLWSVSNTPALSSKVFKTREEAQAALVAYEPLMAHAERLALKAAIDHARSEGATKIAIQDAPSAMMMEGHDRRTIPTIGTTGNKPEDYISQAPGMRLHYDRTLPKIAEELTGGKGERVELGEHKMALANPNSSIDAWEYVTPNKNYATREEAATAMRKLKAENPDKSFLVQENTSGFGIITTKEAMPYRKDLIFRNPDGTPKTSVTARVFDISKPSARLAAGEPMTQMGKMYSGADLPKEVQDAIKKAATYIGQGHFTPIDKLPEKPARVNPEAPTKLEATLAPVKTTTPIESRDVSRAQPGEKMSFTDKLRNEINSKLNLASKADKMLMPVDAIFDRMDGNGGKYNGWLFKNVRQPLDEAFNYELNLRDSMADPVTSLVKKFNLDERNAERIGVYAHSLQKGGVERMLKSGISQDTIDKITRTITPQEKQVYNSMRTFMDESLPAVQSVMKELYGENVKPVENYFPMPRDYNVYEEEPPSIAKGEFDDHGTWRVLSGDYEPRGEKTEQGFTISRKPGAKTAVKINAFEIYQQHVRDVAHLLAMQKTLHEIGKTVRRPLFAEKYGDVGQDMTLDWLNTIARQGKAGKQIALLDAIRNNTSKSIIGFRLASQIVHSANVPLAWQRAGIVNWHRGLSDSLGERGAAFLKEHFAESYERGGGEPSLVDVSKDKGARWVFGIQRAIDRANTQATIMGVYRDELSKKGKNPDAYDTLPFDKDAAAKAMVLARRAVASPLYKDLPPALVRGGSLGKMFFQFQNTFLDQWSNIRHDLISAGILKANPALTSQLAIAIAAMMLIETGIKFGVKNAALMATGNEPEGGDKYWKRLETDALRRVPGMGQLMSEVLYGETGVPTLDVATGAVKGGIEAVTGKKIQGYPNAKPSEKVRNEGAVKAVSSAAELTGVPGVSQASELALDAMKKNQIDSKKKKKPKYSIVQ